MEEILAFKCEAFWSGPILTGGTDNSIVENSYHHEKVGSIMNVLSTGPRSVQLYALQKANETSEAALEITAAALSGGSRGKLSIDNATGALHSAPHGTGTIIDIKV